MVRLVSPALEFAVSLRRRATGMLLHPSDLLLLAPCRDIHTFGMKGDLDIAFLDREGTVLMACRGVGPSKRVRCKNACAVLERPSQEGGWLLPGQRIGLAIVSDEEKER